MPQSQAPGRTSAPADRCEVEATLTLRHAGGLIPGLAWLSVQVTRSDVGGQRAGLLAIGVEDVQGDRSWPQRIRMLSRTPSWSMCASTMCRSRSFWPAAFGSRVPWQGSTVMRFCSFETSTHTDSGRRTRLGFLCGREAGRLVRHESRRRAMARVAGHLSVEDLEAGFRSARDPTAARHFQVIWLLARGHTIADVSAVTSFVPRWIEQLLARYNAKGPDTLGDLRRRNGGVPRVLRPALLERLRTRLTQPPPDGGLWSSRKVAAWMAGERGRAAVLPQRGREALKAINWSVQKPRPRHPAAATPE